MARTKKITKRKVVKKDAAADEAAAEVAQDEPKVEIKESDEAEAIALDDSIYNTDTSAKDTENKEGQTDNTDETEDVFGDVDMSSDVKPAVNGVSDVTVSAEKPAKKKPGRKKAADKISDADASTDSKPTVDTNGTKKQAPKTTKKAAAKAKKADNTQSAETNTENKADRAAKAKQLQEAAVHRKAGTINEARLKECLEKQEYWNVLTVLNVKYQWGAMAVDEFSRSLPQKRSVTVHNAEVHIGNNTYHGHYYADAAQALKEACKGVYATLRSSVIDDIPEEYKKTKLTMDKPIAAYTTFPPTVTGKAVAAPPLTVTTSANKKGAKPAAKAEDVDIDYKRYIMQFSDQYKITPLNITIDSLPESKGVNQFQGRVDLAGWFNIAGPIQSTKKAAAAAVNRIAAEALRARVVDEDHPYKAVETPIRINGLQVPSLPSGKRARDATGDKNPDAKKQKVGTERGMPYLNEDKVPTMPETLTVKLDSWKQALISMCDGMKWGTPTFADEKYGYEHQPFYRTIVTIKGLKAKSYTGPWEKNKKLSVAAASKRAFVDMCVNRFKPHANIADSQAKKIQVTIEPEGEVAITKKFKGELDVSEAKSMKALGVSKSTKPAVLTAAPKKAPKAKTAKPKSGGNSAKVKKGKAGYGKPGQYTNGVYKPLNAGTRAGQKGAPLVTAMPTPWYGDASYTGQASWGQNGVAQSMNGMTNLPQGHPAYAPNGTPMNDGSYPHRPSSTTFYNNDNFQAYQQQQQHQAQPASSAAYSQGYNTRSRSTYGTANVTNGDHKTAYSQGYTDHPAPSTSTRRY